MTVFKWSRTASANATADSSINYQTNQAPATINDAGRAAMAAIAKWRDDISGGAVTDSASTGTAYVLYSSQGFDTLAHLDGRRIAFTPTITNAGTVVLNVDNLGAKPLRSSSGVEIPANTLLAGTPYAAVYNNTDGAFYLSGFHKYPSVAPIGTVLNYAGSSLPSSSWTYSDGRSLSRSTYASLFALIGTTFGAGDGSTTFNLPDCRGRAIFGLDNMGGSDASRLIHDSTISSNRNILGAGGGADGVTLVASQIPNIASSRIQGIGMNGSATASGGGTMATSYSTVRLAAGGSPLATITAVVSGYNFTVSGSASFGMTTAGRGTGGSSPVHDNMPPAILLHKIMRVL